MNIERDRGLQLERPEWLDLSGKIALVTGARQGIGRSTAEVLASHGATVVANYKDASCYPHELVDAYKVIPAEGDIAEPEAVRGVFQQCLRVAGPPDILVSNAGIYPRVDVLDMSLAAWDEVQAVNLRGGLLCMQEAGRLMLTRRTGSIVMIASDAPFKGSPRGAHYAASKAGLLALTRCFARRL